MSKLSLILAIVAFFVVIFLKNSACQEIEEKRKDENKYSPLWFGPRVGRKKRNPDSFWGQESEEIAPFLEFVRKNPWSIVLFHNGKSRMFDYSPKEAAEEILNDENVRELRSMFAPRLGRNPAFFPRMGRENEQI